MLLVCPQFYSKLNEQLNKKAWLQSGPKVSQGRAPSKPGVSLLYFVINRVFSFILLMMPGWIPLVSYNFLFFSAKRCRNSWYREEDGGTIQEERWWYQYGKNYLLLSLMVLRIMRHIRLRIVMFLRCRHDTIFHATLHVMLQKLDPTVYVTICVTLLVHGEIRRWWHHMQCCTGGHMVWSLIFSTLHEELHCASKLLEWHIISFIFTDCYCTIVFCRPLKILMPSWRRYHC